MHDHQLHRKLRLRQLLTTLLYHLFVLVAAYGEGVVLLLNARENEVLVLAGDGEVRVEWKEAS